MNQSNPSRRDFLKGSAAAAAARRRLSVARSAHADAGGPLKVALIGCGGRGAGAASDLLSVADDVKIVALADVFEDRAKGAWGHFKQNFAEKVDIPSERVFVGLDAYKKAIDCGRHCDSTTPPGFRPLIYKAAIEAGKTRLHGKALLRRRARLPSAHGDK